jgi:hypothetical protein
LAGPALAVFNIARRILDRTLRVILWTGAIIMDLLFFYSAALSILSKNPYRIAAVFIEKSLSKGEKPVKRKDLP